eukprot:gene1087-1639_t
MSRVQGEGATHHAIQEHGGVAYLTVYGNLIITDCNVAHNEAGMAQLGMSLQMVPLGMLLQMVQLGMSLQMVPLGMLLQMVQLGMFLQMVQLGMLLQMVPLGMLLQMVPLGMLLQMGDGGVAYSEQNENIIITRSDMTSNTAGWDGGVVLVVVARSFTMTASQILENTAAGQDGGVAACTLVDQVMIMDSKLTLNQAESVSRQSMTIVSHVVALFL